MFDPVLLESRFYQSSLNQHAIKIGCLNKAFVINILPVSPYVSIVISEETAGDWDEVISEGINVRENT